MLQKELAASCSHAKASPGSTRDEAIIAVAATWADHFAIKPGYRETFIAHYVRRVREHRFWVCSGEVGQRRHTVCRLGEVLFFYDGMLVQARHLPGTRFTAKYDPGCWGGGIRTKVRAPIVTPSGLQVGALIRRLKPVFARAQPCAAVFDSMTTFSKAFRSLASAEVDGDIDYPANNDKSRDCRYTRPRTAFYNRLGASTLKRFLAELDPQIVRTVRGVGCPSFTLYNWIAVGDVQRRIQAVRAYPLLLPFLILRCEHRDKDYDAAPVTAPFGMAPLTMRLGELVDGGERIQPLLSDWYGWPERAITGAASFPTHQTGSALRHIGRHGWDGSLSAVLVASFLGNKRPKTKAEWGVWASFYDYMPVHLRCSVSAKRWPAFLAGCPEWSDPQWAQLLERVYDIRDLGFDPENGPIPDLTLRQLLNLSADWHDSRDQLVRELAAADEATAAQGDAGWIGMLPDGLVHPATGVEIVELTLPVELFLEGRALRHCVDGYSDACYSGRSRIVSFRKEGKSLATAEYRLKPWENKPSIKHLYCAQLRGIRNAAIADASEAGRAYTWLMGQLRGRKIQANLAWPNVPYYKRPVRMRDRATKIQAAMDEWLLQRLAAQGRKQTTEAA